MTDSPRLMTHFIAGYPDLPLSLDAARGMLDGGASYIECQFPFSDPTGDGPTIDHACQVSLRNGFTIERGFETVAALKSESNTPLFIMSYANPPFVYGIERFCKRAEEAGADGLIIPDLGSGYDEGLYTVKTKLKIVPVITPNILPTRRETILKKKPEYIYAGLRSGPTGRKSSLGDELLRFLSAFRETGCKLFGGFGIREPSQVQILAPHLHAAVVGSFLVETITQAARDGEEVRSACQSRVSHLLSLS